MSSTSSSECMCSECYNANAYNFAAAYRSSGFRTRAPYYQNFRQPLVYYAQVPAPSFRQRSRDTRKETPNCFVKAFRWYTQAHYPPQSRELPSDRTDLNGFAVWLDRKYDEFMLDKRAEQEHFLKDSRTPLRDDKTEVAFNQNQRTTSSRMKSPFMNLPCSGRGSKECGDTPNKCNQSFEYILKPKELSRPASECYYKIPSSDKQASKKTITKIRAHSSERIPNEKCSSVPIEVIKIQGNLIERTQTLTNASRTETKTKVNCEEKQRVAPQVNTVDVSCQCPEEPVVTCDVKVQCKCDEELKTRTTWSLISNRCCPNCGANAGSVLERPTSPTQIKVRGNHIDTKPPVMAEKPEVKDEISQKRKSSDKIVKKRDAQNQSKRAIMTTECYCTTDDDLKSLSPETSYQVNASVPESSVVTCPCSKVAINPYRPLAIREIPFIAREVTCPRYSTEPLSNSEASQTSDHSICLDTDGYPLFMKIINADKLNEEIIRKQ